MAMCRMDRFGCIERIIVVVVSILMVALVTPVHVSAHGAEKGEDVGFARLTGQVDQLTETIQIEILEPDACDRFTPRRLVSQLDVQTATGTLVAAGACTFAGTITFPGRGAWFVYAQFNYDGRQVQVLLPVSVSGDARDTVREDWIHAPAAPAGSSNDASREGLTRFLPFAGVGLLIGLAALVGYRVVAAARRPRNRAPERRTRSRQRARAERGRR